MTEPSNFWIGLYSSGISTAIYTFTLTPLDVIKNTQISSTQSSPLKAIRQLVKSNGIKSLWRGLSASLLTTYSSNLIYYPLYEKTRPLMENEFGWIGPGISAIGCRFLAVLITLPMERFRTNLQGTGFKRFSLSSFGLKATLSRDLIFGFIFFMTMENLYDYLKHEYPNSARTISCSIGALSAGTLTHPFDVVKTKIQTKLCCYSYLDKHLYKGLDFLYKTQGYKALFIGFQARITKIVFGLVLYINSYEYIKKQLRDK
jgi:solute carrier family 25, member 39/40